MDRVQSLLGWAQQASPSRGTLCLSLINAQQLLQAYGSQAFCNALATAFEQRLRPYGIVSGDVVVVGHLVLVNFSGAEPSLQDSEDWLLEQIKAAVCYEPILCESQQVLVTVLTMWMGAVAEMSAGPRPFPADLHVAAQVIAFAEIDAHNDEQTRGDMALATHFVEQMHKDAVVLVFQPVMSLAESRHVLYYEALLRYSSSHIDYSHVSTCSMATQALERLRMVERLDASVVWAVIHELERHPTVRIACSISPLSLQQSGWWRLVLAVLEKVPSLAQRLLLKVTTTTALFDMSAAVELLRSLHARGCRLVIDDIGVHPINLELAGYVTPDFIKINKPQVCAGRVEGGVDALRSWIDVSRSLCRAVIADGIDTESDLQISLSTGAHAAQGHFIDSLHKSPSWRATPLRVQDVFNPIYRDIAMKHYFSGGVGKR